MAKILDDAQIKFMKRCQPSPAASKEITAAVENLNKILEKHKCTAYVDQVCGNLAVFKQDSGVKCLDGDERTPAGLKQVLPLHVTTPFKTYNAEHDLFFAK